MPTKKSEFSLREGAEYNTLHSSQSWAKNCFLSPLTESRPQLCTPNSHWSSLLLHVTALVDVKDQNSWHTVFRGIQCLSLAGAIENPSHKSAVVGSDQEKNTADRSKKLLNYFSQEKLLMRQKDVVPQPLWIKSNKYMAINIFKGFCKY